MEDKYLNLIQAIVDFACPDSTLTFTEGSNDNYVVTVSPSNPFFREDIIFNLLAIHHMMKVPIKFSSSLKIQKNISYFLEK